MKVAITGANGKVAQALIGQLDPEKFEITPLDLPEHDATDVQDLIGVTEGHDALIHLAWKNLNTETVDPANREMYQNAYIAAAANNIGLVIMGSSNHARWHKQIELDGRIRYTNNRRELANNVYGEEKQRMEELGQFYARTKGMGVVCVRIGNINVDDQPNDAVPTRWMSHRDWGNMVTLALTHQFEPGHFEVVYGVSEQPLFDWVNSFGYEPQDSAV